MIKVNGITGEGLNVIIGNIPYKCDDVDEKVKLNILSLLNEKYGIYEEDFTVAEIEIVPAGFDPNFPDVLDKRNASFIGKGVTLSKYTGVRGKSGSNDANAEFLAEVRDVFNESHVTWQVGELGKADQGGGGTIAYILANKGADVVDCGTPMLSMHAPIELISKVELYMTYKAYKAFYQG